MNQWYEYVVSAAGTDNQTHIQLRTGIPQSTIAKWKKGNQPLPAQVQKFAIALDLNVLEAFIHAGFLTPEQAAAAPAIFDLAEVSGDMLAEEVSRRLRAPRTGDHLGDEDWRAKDPGRRSSTILRFARWLTGEEEETLAEQRREFLEAGQHVRAGMLDAEEVADLLDQRAAELDQRIAAYEKQLDLQIAEHAGDAPEALLEALREREIDFNAFKSITMARYFSNLGLYGRLVDLVLEHGGRTVAVDSIDASTRPVLTPEEQAEAVARQEAALRAAVREPGRDDPQAR